MRISSLYGSFNRRTSHTKCAKMAMFRNVANVAKSKVFAKVKSKLASKIANKANGRKWPAIALMPDREPLHPQARETC